MSDGGSIFCDGLYAGRRRAVLSMDVSATLGENIPPTDFGEDRD